MVRALRVTSSPVRPSPRVDAVDLQLAQELLRRTDLGLHPGGPGRQLFGVEHVVQAQHPLQMVRRGEVGGEARAADQLGGRIRGAQLGMRVLEFLQLPQQDVELGVGDDRGVAHVVAELMLTNFVGEFLPLPAQRRFRRVRCQLIAVCAHPGRL